MKAFLSDTLDEAYQGLGDELAGFKSALLGLCIDIDRYLDITCHIDIGRDADQTEFRKALTIFSRFKSLSLGQFNRYLALFREIHDENAHHHLARPIHFDENLERFVLGILPIRTSNYRRCFLQFPKTRLMLPEFSNVLMTVKPIGCRGAVNERDGGFPIYPTLSNSTILRPFFDQSLTILSITGADSPFKNSR